MLHDHQGCIQTALSKAESICQQRKLRFTALRRQVLELVWRNHKPVGAYCLLDQLKTKNNTPAPPTIYRTLDFLLAKGFVHRIASLNAYIGCPFADRQHVSQFLVCNLCKDVTEIHDKRLSGSVYQSAQDRGFKPQRQVLEIFGTCHACQ